MQPHLADRSLEVAPDPLVVAVEHDPAVEDDLGDVGGGRREDRSVLVGTGARRARARRIEEHDAVLVEPERRVTVDGRAAQQRLRRPVPAHPGPQPVVHLHPAHLLEQVDDRVAVGAERDPGARGPQVGPAAEPVGQVALRRRAEADEAAGVADDADVGVRHVRRVHERRAGAEHAGIGEQLGRAESVRRQAGVVLRGLLGQVDVQRLARGPGRHRAHLVLGHGPHAVDRRAHRGRRRTPRPARPTPRPSRR